MQLSFLAPETQVLAVVRVADHLCFGLTASHEHLHDATVQSAFGGLLAGGLLVGLDLLQSHLGPDFMQSDLGFHHVPSLSLPI